MTPLRLISQTIILCCLGFATLFLIFSEPEEASSAWLDTLLISKAAGIATGAAFFKLHRRWMRQPEDIGQSVRTPAAREPQSHCRQQSYR